MVIDRSIAERESSGPGLVSALKDLGIDTLLVTSEEDLRSIGPEGKPDLALVDVAYLPGSVLSDCVRRCSSLELPVIALVSEDRVADLDITLDVDDFVLAPPRTDELVARARRVLGRTATADDGDLIRIRDLAINPANYEVSLKGRHLNLRFKEYELLLLLAANPGRVFSRETLLNRIWGYQYYGGIRTVDVHIRRLRSKLQDADHPLIETVWNVGYRFRDMRHSS